MVCEQPDFRIHYETHHPVLDGNGYTNNAGTHNYLLTCRANFMGRK